MSVIHKLVDIGSAIHDKFDFCLTKERIDRAGDLVVIGGMKYKLKIIMLWSHKSDDPIGNVINPHRVGDELRGRLEFAPDGISSKITELKNLVLAGVINSVSIGFIPLKQSPIFNSSGQRTGTRFDEFELIEVSLVSCPMNADAVSLAKRLKTSDPVMKMVFEPMVFEPNISTGERIRRTRAAIQKVKTMLLTEDNPSYRKTLQTSLRLLQESEYEMTAPLLPSSAERAQRAINERRMEEAAQRLEVAKIVYAEKQTASWQKKAEHDRNVAAFTKTAAELEARYQRSKPVVPTSKEGHWRGQDLRPKWRGQTIEIPKWRFHRDDE